LTASAACYRRLPVRPAPSPRWSSSAITGFIFLLDGKRGLLQKAARPAGSESPLEFDAYTLNHAAFVGTQETAWVTDFEQELTRRGVFVVKGDVFTLINF
jgi:hypothetical protein